MFVSLAAELLGLLTVLAATAGVASAQGGGAPVGSGDTGSGVGSPLQCHQLTGALVSVGCEPVGM
jgi:hypothetical protein